MLYGGLKSGAKGGWFGSEGSEPFDAVVPVVEVALSSGGVEEVGGEDFFVGVVTKCHVGFEVVVEVGGVSV